MNQISFSTAEMAYMLRVLADLLEVLDPSMICQVTIVCNPSPRESDVLFRQLPIHIK